MTVTLYSYTQTGSSFLGPSLYYIFFLLIVCVYRWLFGEIICQVYAMCGVLFGLCSLTNLTVLSLVCCLKVCVPNHGEGGINWYAWCCQSYRKFTSSRSKTSIITSRHLFLFPLLSGNNFSSSHAHLLVAGVWCYASVFALGPLAHWGHYSLEPYGTACCIDWHAPNYELSALSYIICLFFFCYVVPCTIIFLSYTFILLTVRGSRQAVQQHVSPQAKSTNAHALIVKVRGYGCVASAPLTIAFIANRIWVGYENINN